jgi:hypothetical protein
VVQYCVQYTGIKCEIHRHQMYKVMRVTSGEPTNCQHMIQPCLLAWVVKVHNAHGSLPLALFLTEVEAPICMRLLGKLCWIQLPTSLCQAASGIRNGPAVQELVQRLSCKMICCAVTRHAWLTASCTVADTGTHAIAGCCWGSCAGYSCPHHCAKLRAESGMVQWIKSCSWFRG